MFNSLVDLFFLLASNVNLFSHHVNGSGYLSGRLNRLYKHRHSHICVRKSKHFYQHRLRKFGVCVWCLLISAFFWPNVLHPSFLNEIFDTTKYLRKKRRSTNQLMFYSNRTQLWKVRDVFRANKKDEHRPLLSRFSLIDRICLRLFRALVVVQRWFCGIR